MGLPDGGAPLVMSVPALARLATEPPSRTERFEDFSLIPQLKPATQLQQRCLYLGPCSVQHFSDDQIRLQPVL
jgi:hypothetical protein